MEGVSRTKRRKSKKSVLLLGGFIVVVVLCMSVLAFNGGGEKMIVRSGQKVLVERTVKLEELRIEEGGVIEPITGHELTLTVNGVGMPLLPGVYKGEVVLSLTRQTLIRYRELPPHRFKTAVYVEDGRFIPEKSVSAMIRGNYLISDGLLQNPRITCNEEKVNGVMVEGNGRYVIVNPQIYLRGNGGNDFAGYGAAIRTSGQSDVIVNNAVIITEGCIRPAIFVGGNSKLTVYNSFIESRNGILPSDYKFTIEMGKMMECPWMLGIKGNNRTTLLAENGTVAYINSHIRCEAWGALSTDDAKKVRMYVENSYVETVKSGYGAYAIGDCEEIFKRTVFDVADYGLIMANENASAVFTDGSVVRSRRFGVMAHMMNVGKLVIEKGSVFYTKKPAIQLKTAFPEIIIDAAQVHSESGIILQAVENDDPFLLEMGPPPGPPPAGEGPAPKPPEPRPINVYVRNTEIKGDFMNALTKVTDLNVIIENATITGAITTAKVEHVKGPKGEQITMAHPELYYLIGEFIPTYCATEHPHGVKVVVKQGGKWVVDKTSYLNELVIESGGSVVATPGKILLFKVNGERKELKPGTYRGKIVLEVK